MLPSAKENSAVSSLLPSLVKICKVAAFQRILCAGKRIGNAQRREADRRRHCPTGRSPPRFTAAKASCSFSYRRSVPTLGAQFRLRKLPDRLIPIAAVAECDRVGLRTLPSRRAVRTTVLPSNVLLSSCTSTFPPNASHRCDDSAAFRIIERTFGNIKGIPHQISVKRLADQISGKYVAAVRCVVTGIQRLRR